MQITLNQPTFTVITVISISKLYIRPKISLSKLVCLLKCRWKVYYTFRFASCIRICFDGQGFKEIHKVCGCCYVYFYLKVWKRNERCLLFNVQIKLKFRILVLSVKPEDLKKSPRIRERAKNKLNPHDMAITSSGSVARPVSLFTRDATSSIGRWDGTFGER